MAESQCTSWHLGRRFGLRSCAVAGGHIIFGQPTAAETRRHCARGMAPFESANLLRTHGAPMLDSLDRAGVGCRCLCLCLRRAAAAPSRLKVCCPLGCRRSGTENACRCAPSAAPRAGAVSAATLSRARWGPPTAADRRRRPRRCRRIE